LGRNIAKGNATLADGLWVGADLVAVALDIFTAGTVGEGMEAAMAPGRAARLVVAAAKSVEVLSAADKVNAVGHGADAVLHMAAQNMENSGNLGSNPKKTCPPKVAAQMAKRGLPNGGQTPFVPKLIKGPKGDLIMDSAEVTIPGVGPKVGFVDDQGRIWVRDNAHAGYPQHWDVQINGGKDYFRVGMDGNPVSRPQ